MTAIVCVHGIGNHRPGAAPITAATHLAHAWRDALNNGPHGPIPETTALTAAYYAHRLRRPGSQAGTTDLDQLPPAAQALIRQWLDEVDPPRGAAQGRLTRSLRRDIARFAANRGLSQKTVEIFIGTCFEEVARYLDPDAPHRILARAEVANAIAAANRADPTTIVIAHSLGSVVTYETLHAYRHLRVDRLITIGSPLAMPNAVYHRLQPDPRPRGRRPLNVDHWTNIADTGDIIAIPPRGIRDQFDGVDEDREIAIHWSDFHLAANYLKTQAVADALGPNLT